jgi:hypothetical protein
VTTQRPAAVDGGFPAVDGGAPTTGTAEVRWPQKMKYVIHNNATNDNVLKNE